MLKDIAVLAALILLAGFLAAVETSLASASKNARKPDRQLMALKLIISFISLYTAVYAVSSFDAPVAVVIFILSFLAIIFCRMLPDRFAGKYSQGINRIFSPVVKVVSFVLTPLSAALIAATDALAGLFRLNSGSTGTDVTEEEIRQLVIAGGETGTIEEAEKEMINNIFEFNNTTVDEICTHRKDIFALSLSSSINEIIRAAAVERYTRIPVYSENIDNIEGILHIKDIFGVVMEQNNERDDFDLRQIIHKPYFVPLSKTTDRLFHEMKKNKVHIAIVVDEYGGTAGLVTMEDLIEEIMGSIQDEYDEEERQEITLVSNNTYEVSGTAELETVAEYFESSLPTDDYDTLGGFLMAQLGRVPADGEQPEIEYENLLFKVHKVEDRRISVVIVCKL